MLWPIDFGSSSSETTGLLQMPIPINFIVSPIIPNLFLKRLADALPSSPQVFMPSADSLSLSFEPMPHSSFTGRRSNTSGTSSGLIHLKPSGFDISLASFAINIFGPMPTVQFMPNLSLIIFLIEAPIASGPPNRWCVVVMSRNASSME